jgi:transcriptional regulator with XRE-family HTH domain
MEAKWFAGRLRELREGKGISREHLAESAAIKASAVRDIEQGVYSPNWETVLALCQALGVSCEVFTQEPTERPPATPGRPKKPADEPLPTVEAKPAPKKAPPPRAVSSTPSAADIEAQEEATGRKAPATKRKRKYP